MKALFDPPYTFFWSTGATTECISVDTAGDYTVQVFDANGCSVVAMCSSRCS